MHIFRPSITDKIDRVSARRRTSRHQTSRRGAASVEMSLVAIPLFLFVGASIEFGRAMMTTQAMEEAARSGCRLAVLDGASHGKVETELENFLAASGINEYSTEIEPVSLSTMPQWAPVTVRISANFSDMTWLPVPGFFDGASYTASCVLPREAEPETP